MFRLLRCKRDILSGRLAAINWQQAMVRTGGGFRSANAGGVQRFFVDRCEKEPTEKESTRYYETLATELLMDVVPFAWSERGKLPLIAEQSIAQWDDPSH